MPKGTVVTDPFTRTTSGGWGTAPGGLVWSWFGAGGTTQASDFATNGSTATVSVPASTAYRAPYLSAFDEADVDVAITGVVGTATGAPLEFLNLLTRGTSLTSYYLGRVQIETTGVLTAYLFTPDGTQLDSVAVPIPPPASGTRVRMRMQSIGQYHRLKVWLASGTEPPHWLLSATDDSYTGAGWVGCRGGVASGNTNTKPYVFTFDDFASVRVPDYAADKVPLQVLWAPGADPADDYRTWPWVDITADVLQANGGRVTISPVGRSDESSVAQPAGCSFGLKNISGDYTAYNPAGKYYPDVRRNTPIWVLVNGVTRFFGFADSFTPTWDTSGRAALVSVSASGTLRRLMQGRTPLRSPVTRAVLAAQPYQYWPCEDGQSATQAASALPDGRPMTADGTVGFGDFDPHTDGLVTGRPFGTEALANISGASLSAAFPPGSSTSWTVQLINAADVIDDAKTVTIVQWTVATGGTTQWRIVSDGTLPSGTDWTRLEVRGSGSFVEVCGFAGIGVWADLRVDAVQSGSDIAVTLRTADSDGSVLTDTGTISGTTLGGVNSITLNPDRTSLSLNDALFGIGHVRIFNGNDAPNFQTDTASQSAWMSYNGENAKTRLVRLCTEEDADLVTNGDTDIKMGPQSVDTFLNVLRECEAADLGLLYDGFSPGLTYSSRAERYDETASLTLDASIGQVAPPFTPVDDDQINRNLIKVSRKNGSSATYQDADGPLGTAAIGVYDDSRTVNHLDDTRLLDFAAWLVHLGTVEGFRYPTLSLNLRRTPGKADDWLATPILGRIDVENVSNVLQQHPPGTISLLLEGYTEEISPHDWTVQANCSPHQPWNVAALGSTFRLEMASQTLAADLDPGDTTLSLATASGHARFTTSSVYPDDFPLYLNVGGWQVRVTAASGTSSPQTLTIDAAPNTATIDAGTAVTLWHPAALAL